MSLSQTIGEKLLANRSLAGMVAAVCTAVPGMTWLGSIVLALVTLQNGTKAGLDIMIWAWLPVVVHAYFGSLWGLVYNGLVGLVAVWCFAIVLRLQQDWRGVLQMITFMGALTLGLIHIFYPESVGWWLAKLTQGLDDFYRQLLPLVSVEQGQYLDYARVEIKKGCLLQEAAKVMTGGVICLLLYSNAINFIMARWWQSKLNSGINFRRELLSVRIDRAILLLAIVSVVLLFWTGGWVSDFVGILCLPLLPVGLSLVHCGAARLTSPLLWLIGFYLLVIAFSPFSLLVVMGLGIIDVMVDVRRRFDWGFLREG